MHYGVRPSDHRIDFDQVASLAREHKPKLIVTGASAYPREIDHARFAEIARDVGALFMVDMAHYAGLVAAGIHNSPVPVALDRPVGLTLYEAVSRQLGLKLATQKHPMQVVVIDHMERTPTEN